MNRLCRMKTLTLRGVDQELAAELERLAAVERESMNATVLRLLRDGLGLSKPKFNQTHTDLDDLAGTWTEEDRRAFEAATSAFSKIDEGLWR